VVGEAVAEQQAARGLARLMPGGELFAALQPSRAEIRVASRLKAFDLRDGVA